MQEQAESSEDDNSESIYEEESDSNGSIYEEDDNDDGDNIPSDLKVDHHPGRECQYFFDHEEADNHKEIGKEDEWVVGDLCVSQKCRGLKDNTLSLKILKNNEEEFKLKHVLP